MNRQEADKEFEKQMRRAESAGKYDKSGEKMGRWERERMEAEVKEAQRKMKIAIEAKLKDNQKLGRTYNDGQTY